MTQEQLTKANELDKQRSHVKQQLKYLETYNEPSEVRCLGKQGGQYYNADIKLPKSVKSTIHMLMVSAYNDELKQIESEFDAL